MSVHSPQTTDRQSTAAGLLVRLSWMLLGNAVLGLSAVLIFRNTTGFFHTADAIFWITVAGLVLLRYIDIRFLNGLTAAGAPASARHWVRYVIILSACSVAVWTFAHAMNHLVVRA
jgi:hypothetical protein